MKSESKLKSIEYSDKYLNKSFENKASETNLDLNFRSKKLSFQKIFKEDTYLEKLEI